MVRKPIFHAFNVTLTWRYALRSKSWYILEHEQQLYEILAKSTITVVSYDQDKNLDYACSVNLTLEIWPVEGHYAPFGHGEQCFKISRSNNREERYDMDTDLHCVCILTLTFEI